MVKNALISILSSRNLKNLKEELQHCCHLETQTLPQVLIQVQLNNLAKVKIIYKKNSDSITTLAKEVSLESTSINSQDMMKIIQFARTFFCYVR